MGKISNIIRIGASPADSAETRLQKQLLVAISLMISTAALFWGGIYFAFDKIDAAAIPWTYTAISWINIAVFAASRRYGFFRLLQLLLILALPLALQLVLGGFVSGSAVAIWALMCPIGALVFSGPTAALRWLAAYIALLILTGAVEPLLPPVSPLPEPVGLVFFVMNLGVVSGIAFVSMWSFIRDRDTALGLLREEQERSENLLLNILPKSIAELLKVDQGTIAESFDSATIVFADIVNFTPLAAAQSAEATVEMLGQTFSHFDTLVEKHEVEKIGTMGDSYMAAAGVPVSRPDHAHAAARFALDIRDYVRGQKVDGASDIDFRIGISSGPIVAGVIGQKKFAYDVWGDAVNTASRMESHGIAGKIQISQSTFELIKDEFDCEPRGTIEVKGKGELETWFLLGPRDSAATYANGGAKHRPDEFGS